MSSVEQEFLRRVSRIPRQGVGLSVDVYTPPLFELIDALELARVQFGYLEIFKAPGPALADVRRRLDGIGLQYHAEGLWVPHPRLKACPQFDATLATEAMHLAALGSYWMNHECAAKQMAGYSFGTYLPPLFTKAAADQISENATLIQQRLGASEYFSSDCEPLLLLEIPPLTYFGFGDLSVAGFFRRIVTQASCGLVLDIGHVWTVYRYSGCWRRQSLNEFLVAFLNEFPLERVVQIHLAGLDVHETAQKTMRERFDADVAMQERPPLWIDSHGAPIPNVLWDMLAQVFSHPRLMHLKGIALEVDTKPVSCIVSEFMRLSAQCREWSAGLDDVSVTTEATNVRHLALPVFEHIEELDRQYEEYARIVTNQARTPSNGLALLEPEMDLLDLYRRQYLPVEILEWGGNLQDMFLQTCRELDRRGVSLAAFVEYWFGEPRSSHVEYDFFLLKIGRFLEFIQTVAPDAAILASREAAELREAYQAACEQIGQESVHVHP